MSNVKPQTNLISETYLKTLNDRVGSKLKANGSSPLLILMTFGLAGCGGSGGVGPAMQQSFSSGGTAVKGPLANATVFIDLDDDGMLDTNELSTTTSSTC